MTAPAPQPQPVYAPGAWPPRRLLLVIGAVLFVIAAFAFGDIPAWTWTAAGFAAWVLSGAVP